jgi:prolyl-tRNA editing enzyme YbaK/EbsC (Cys-tRNA(Pro) deacylase)
MFPKAITFQKLTRTAAEAAEQIGCSEAQICKSIVFKSGDGVVLILTSGSNRVNTEAVSARIGMPLEKADADFVREKSGYVIGGVAPWGHKVAPTVYIDETLAQYEQVWASAGTANSVFPTNFKELREQSGAQIISVL